MSRLFGISLILALSVPFLATWFWLQNRLNDARYDASILINSMEKDDLNLLLTFALEETTTQLRWEHAHEFEYKGQMYDIISFESCGDSISYWCYWDRKETKVKNEMRMLMANFLGPGPLRSSQQQQLFHFLKNIFIQPYEGLENKANIVSNARGSTSYTTRLASIIIPPPVPPPRLV